MAEFPDVSENGGRRRTETMKPDAHFVHVGLSSRSTANVSLVREKERKPR
jgi:hypothetical protein